VLKRAFKGYVAPMLKSSLQKLYCHNYSSIAWYGDYISQLIHYHSACPPYSDFLDRAQLLIQKVLKQGYAAPKLKSSLQKITIITIHEMVDRYEISISQMTKDILHFTQIFTVATMIWLNDYGIRCVTNDQGYVPFVVIKIRPFPHSRLVTQFVTRETQWISQVEQ
jgi:hypothetical protein